MCSVWECSWMGLMTIPNSRLPSMATNVVQPLLKFSDELECQRCTKEEPTQSFVYTKYFLFDRLICVAQVGCIVARIRVNTKAVFSLSFFCFFFIAAVVVGNVINAFQLDRHRVCRTGGGLSHHGSVHALKVSVPSCCGNFCNSVCDVSPVCRSNVEYVLCCRCLVDTQYFRSVFRRKSVRSKLCGKCQLHTYVRIALHISHRREHGNMNELPN